MFNSYQKIIKTFTSFLDLAIRGVEGNHEVVVEPKQRFLPVDQQPVCWVQVRVVVRGEGDGCKVGRGHRS